MLTERANAKINLFLDVLSRREDGYHNLSSLMHSVSLCDLVTVDFRPEFSTAIRLEASGDPRMPTDCRNLAWRAAERFLSHVKRSGKVWIRIEKHIPMEAGLAGGSADAAAVLRALNRLLGSPLSTDELCTLGATLGADVPFCIRGGAALVEGIGERLTPLTPLSRIPLVIACMGEGISTPWAYGRLDVLYRDFLPPRETGEGLSSLLSAMETGDISGVAAHCFNLFSSVVEEERPAVLAIRRRMEEAGALVSMMSGSGPSVFGIFEDVSAAAKATETLQAMGASAFVCHPMRASLL